MTESGRRRKSPFLQVPLPGRTSVVDPTELLHEPWTNDRTEHPSRHRCPPNSASESFTNEVGCIKRGDELDSALDDVVLPSNARRCLNLL